MKEVCLLLRCGCVISLLFVSVHSNASQAVRRAQRQLEQQYEEAIKFEPRSMIDLAETYDVPTASADGKPQKWTKTKAFFNKMLDKIVITAQDVENALKGVITDTAKLFTAPYKAIIKKEQRAIYANPYKDTVAQVRKGGAISEGEAEYLKVRRLITRRGLEKFLGITFPDDVPTPDVMISLSGGGSRAMILAWAFMRAIETIGLLECADYVATLSGSSWFLWPWLVSGLSLEEYKARLVSASERGPVSLRNPNSDINNIVKLLLRMGVYDRPATIITFYGAALGAGLLFDLGDNKDPLQTYMDMTSKAMKGARVPYPVGTFISTPDARWFTETPHEVYCPGIGYGVPEWAFGWKFNKGKSGKTPNPPRRDLPSHLAASSAAIGVSGKDIYYNIFQFMKDDWAKGVLRELLQETSAGQLRFTSAKEYNPFYGVEGLPLYDTLRNQTWGQVQYAHFTDAGVIWIDPIIPLMVRARDNVPVIYLVEAGGGVVGSEELEKTWEYAQGSSPDGKKYKFPAMKQAQQFGKSSLSFLADEDSLVLYFPRVIDDELMKQHREDSSLAKSIGRLNYNMGERLKTVYATFNLKYSKAAVEDLIAVAWVNVLGNAEKIKDVMREYINLYIQRAQGNVGADYKKSLSAFYTKITPAAAEFGQRVEENEPAQAQAQVVHEEHTKEGAKKEETHKVEMQPQEGRSEQQEETPLVEGAAAAAAVD